MGRRVLGWRSILSCAEPSFCHCLGAGICWLCKASRGGSLCSFSTSTSPIIRTSPLRHLRYHGSSGIQIIFAFPVVANYLPRSVITGGCTSCFEHAPYSFSSAIVSRFRFCAAIVSFIHCRRGHFCASSIAVRN